MRLLIIPLLALLNACSDAPDLPPEGDTGEHDAIHTAPAPRQMPLAGSWVMEQDDHYRVMVLGRDGSLHWLPNSPWQGQHWQADDTILTLQSVARLRGEPQTLALNYTLSRDTLTLASEDTNMEKGVSGTWRRDNQAAARIEGELLLPEGHQVPERAVLALHIEPREVRDPDTIDIQREVRPLDAGQTHIPYRLYYDARAVDNNQPLQLQATIIVDGAAHYASEEPVRLAPVTEQSQTVTLSPRGLARGQSAGGE